MTDPRARTAARKTAHVGARRIAAIAALIAAGWGLCCGGDTPTSPSPSPPPTTSGGLATVVPPAAPAPVPVPVPAVPAPAGGPQAFVGAGDIAVCGEPGAQATAKLLDVIGGTVFTLGDTVYFSGTTQEFADCYEPTWGRHKSRTRPVPGNHDYQTAGAAPYFAYFGANAGPPGLGYYSFELGDWHAVALNSNIAVDGASAQVAWLRADLASSRAACTIAYWHHPLFTSGPNKDQPAMREFWRVLYQAGADIVLNGHDHLYERFGPQDFDGRADPQRGIREFIVGTGGAPSYRFVTVHGNSEVRLTGYGVLKLTLMSGRYEWEFVSTSGASDSGTGACH